MRGLEPFRLAGLFLALLVLLAPSQYGISLAGRANLTLAEPLLAFAALFFLWDLWRRGRWREVALPPLEHWLFVLLALISLAVAEDRAEVLKNVVQFGLYFILLHLVVVDMLRRAPQGLSWGLGLVVFGVAVNLALAVFQYFGPDPDPLVVRGAFGNRNVLGGYLALALPLCLVPLVPPGKNRAWSLVLSFLLLLTGFLVMLSGAAFLAIAAGIGLSLLARGKRMTFALWIAGLTLLFTAVYPVLPRGNDIAMLESVDLYDGMGQPNYRYPEWQVAVDMINESPWRGVGAGNYQRHINRYYGLIPNPTGPQEPDIQNLYLVLGVSLGIPGLAVFLLMLGLALRRWAQVAMSAADWRTRAAGRCCVCSLTAFALACLWSPLLVRGVVPLLALVMAAGHFLQIDPPAMKKK